MHIVAATTACEDALHLDVGPLASMPHAGEGAGEEFFRLAARLNTKRVQCQPGLYAHPYQKDKYR